MLNVFCRLHAGRRRCVVLSTTVCWFYLDPACCMLFCCVILLHRFSGADSWVRVSIAGWCGTASALGPLCSCDIYCRRDDVVLRSLITFPVYDCLQAQIAFNFSAAELFVFTNNSKRTPVVWNNRCVFGMFVWVGSWHAFRLYTVIRFYAHDCFIVGRRQLVFMSL